MGIPEQEASYKDLPNEFPSETENYIRNVTSRKFQLWRVNKTVFSDTQAYRSYSYAQYLYFVEEACKIALRSDTGDDTLPLRAYVTQLETYNIAQAIYYKGDMIRGSHFVSEHFLKTKGIVGEIARRIFEQRGDAPLYLHARINWEMYLLETTPIADTVPQHGESDPTLLFVRPRNLRQ